MIDIWSTPDVNMYWTSSSRSRDRRDSIGSMSSIGSLSKKRGSGDSVGGSSQTCQSLAMEATNTILSVGFINIHGQTGVNSAKQAQIQLFLLKNKLDVLNLQEIHVCDDSFSDSGSKCSSFNIISKYGLASSASYALTWF
jgi:hypothetical protein